MSDGSPPPLDAPRFEVCDDDGESLIVVQASDYDVLLARVDDLERERAEADGDWAEIGASQAARAEAAEAEVARLTAALIRCAELTGEDGEAIEAARSGALKHPPLADWAIGCVKQLRRDYDDDAEVARLRTALSEIAELPSFTSGLDQTTPGKIARAALSEGAAE